MSMNRTEKVRKTAQASFLLAGLVALVSLPLWAVDVQTGTVVGKITLKKGHSNENSVVYLKGIQGNYPPSDVVARMDQKGKVFIPHILPVQKGQNIRFGNSDAFSHNTHMYWGRRSLFNQVQGIGGASEWQPKRTGEYLVLCDIHQEMSAFALVLDHPFHTVVEHHSAGEFQIEDVPPGTYTLVVVRDVKGRLKEKTQEITVTAGQTSTVEISF